MANDRLRDALLAARVTHEDLATNLGVNTKTVERWVTQGRTPYPQFRHRISVLVQKDEGWLWPDGYSRQRRSEITESEIVRIYPYRADVPDDLWARLFENAIDNIGILIGDPDCRQVALRGQEEDIGDAIAAKIRNVLLAYYRPYASHPGINIKLHSTTLYNSIYWFDDDMLVNTHAYGVPAHFAPVLHLRHLSSGSLFQTYARSFDRVWDQTRKVWNGREVINGG